MKPRAIGGLSRASALVCATFTALLLIAPPCARAQDSDLNALAAQVAQSLRDANLKKVAVFDFTGPGENVTALGPKLADDFSRALSHAAGDLDVEDRAALAREMKESDYTPEDIFTLDLIYALGAYMKLDAAILGTVSPGADNRITLSLHITRTIERKFAVIDTKDATLALSGDDAKLLQTYVFQPENAADVDKDFPVGGKGGISFPSCLDCPLAQYSDLAVELKLQGTVVLVAVIDTDGRASQVKVVKHLPGGLAKSAVDAVKQWTFRPAADSNGNPVAVRQIIEETFHTY
jgi:hypothetical protein